MDMNWPLEQTSNIRSTSIVYLCGWCVPEPKTLSSEGHREIRGVIGMSGFRVIVE
jgi:hypothetical protein